ncbi:hypothetical protein M8C21_003182, partial [Ambrosia artemisiifolia]
MEVKHEDVGKKSVMKTRTGKKANPIKIDDDSIKKSACKSKKEKKIKECDEGIAMKGVKAEKEKKIKECDEGIAMKGVKAEKGKRKLNKDDLRENLKKCRKTQAKIKDAKIRDIKDHDWSKFIVDNIKCCKDVWEPNSPDYYFTGPYTVLTLLYLDRVACEGVKIERSVPPISYWTKTMMNKRETMETSKGGFGMGDIKELSVDVREYDVESDEEADEMMKEDNVCVNKSLEGKVVVNLIKGVLVFREQNCLIRQQVRVKGIHSAWQVRTNPLDVSKTLDKEAAIKRNMAGTDTNVLRTPVSNYNKAPAAKGSEVVKETPGFNTPFQKNSGLKVNERPENEMSFTQVCVELTDIVELLVSAQKYGYTEKEVVTNRTEDIPSFSLGLTQEFPIAQEWSERVVRDARPGMEPTAYVRRGKRQIKPSVPGCSPYLIRAVDVEKNFNKEEKMLWKYLMEGAVDK